MWSEQRTAGTLLGRAGIPAVLLLFGLGTLIGSGAALAEETPGEPASLRTGLDIGGALQIEFFGELGKAYTVEAQTTAGEWTDVFGPVYGTGTAVEEFISGALSSVALRLKIEDLADLGHAPVEIVGHAYSLNYRAKAVGFLFATADQGVATGQDGVARGFAYTFRKARPDTAEIGITFADGTEELLSLEFWQGRIGEFRSSVTREGHRPRQAVGTFRAGDDVDPDNAAPPQTLEGYNFIFRDRGMVVALEFGTDFSGILSRQGGDTEIVSYTYDISSWPEASILLTLERSDEHHHYTMSFDARNSGIFVRRVIRDNRLHDTDKGRFSGKGVEDEDDDGKGGGNTERDCLAPDSLEGTTLEVTATSGVMTVVLNGAGTGSILKIRSNGRVILLPFTYTYSKESSTEGLLTVTLPGGGGDELQVFELNFTTPGAGDSVRKLYADGEPDDTEEGSFSLTDNQVEGDKNDD